MSLIDKIRNAKKKLHHVEIVVTSEDGSNHYEERSADGSFTKINFDDVDDLREASAAIPEATDAAAQTSIRDSNAVQLSKRQMKKRNRRLNLGYVVDLMPDLQMAKVAEGVYLGSQNVAHSLEILDMHSITHIVNCATGIRNIFLGKMKYLDLNILDLPSFELRPYFEETHSFIRRCVEGGGNVLVHCNAGISRSPTLVLSYLMRYEHKSLQEALEIVRSIRQINPNPGFMRQLLLYESTLKAELALSDSVNCETAS